MRWVTFYSQLAVQSLMTPQRVISITEPGYHVEFPVTHKDILRLHFHDIEEYMPEYTRFSYTDAQEILEFAAKTPENELLVVHCLAGISRSAAVAKFLSDHKGFALLTDRFCSGDLSRYNTLVYGTLRLVAADDTTLLMATEADIERYAKQSKW